jgi:hypothetical protein
MLQIAERQLVPSPELRAFARRQVSLAVGETPDTERRQESRIRIALPAIVQPLDAEFKPRAERFAAVMRDMTKDGLGLIVENELPVGDMFAVQVQIGKGEDACLLAKLLWCKPIGPFYLAGFHGVKALKSMP